MRNVRRTGGDEYSHALTKIAEVNRRLGRGSAADAAVSEHTALSRRSQIACAGPGCRRKLREDGAPLDVCVKCRRTLYCGKDCQTADWKREGGYKAECKALIAAAAAAAADSKTADGGTGK